MISASPIVGTELAVGPPPPARSLAIAPRRAHNLADLLASIKANSSPTNFAMLQVAAKKVAEFRGMPLEQVPVEALAGLGAEFRLNLQARRYKDKTVRTYVHFAKVLLAHAKELSLFRPNTRLSAAWSPILTALGKKAGAATIISYAIGIGRMPEDFSLDDLRAWVQLMQRQERKYSYLDNERSRFRGAMASCGYKQNLCEVFQWRGRYTVTLGRLPAGLRKEIESLAEWKQARFAPGRRRGCRHRPVSAKKLVRFIVQLYGFASTVQKQADIAGLSELITEERTTAFVTWFLNERQRKTNPLRASLGLLAAAVRQYPALEGTDFSWFDELMTSLEEDDAEEEQRHDRKARRALPYDVLAEAPNKIRRIREKSGHTEKETALLVLHELLFRWWLALPWRQRNIRECRIGANPNIFKAELPTSVAIRKPAWVEQALERNPIEQFWQMRFSSQETKTGNAFCAIVPLDLVPLLELYLTQYRQALLSGPDPGTLFLNRRGKPFTDKRLTMLVENLTFQHAGRAINPHLLRDIFAYKWLDDHPEDYLTLSMILWHRDIKTTLRIYGRNFNESNGVCRIDQWLRGRNPNN